ncbi:hypothetical protein DFH09DRAFT_1376999 [Mycena vulgaris]|nr:hypothetical protein DFH09DRAFT_1376999 [Mycena vulgaris]
MAAPPPLSPVPPGLPAHGFLPPTAPTGLTAAAKHGPGGLPNPTASDIAEGAMPAWFQAWDIAHFQPLKQSLDLLHTNFAIFRAQFANGQCATEHQAPSEVVSFTSGDDPTAAPHNLPAIRNSDDIIALTPV